MARQAGGGRERVIPGLSTLLAERARRFDARFCGAGSCGWCARVTALEAAEMVVVSGSSLWLALFDDRRPADWSEYDRDECLYEVRWDRLRVSARPAAASVDLGVDLALVERWYAAMLAQTVPPTDLAWEPVSVGPTWRYDDVGGWSLPAATLGWRVLAWCGLWLRDTDGEPWRFTAEQARFVLWFFAVDESGDWLHHSAVLQRLKGWGKDPVAACLAVAAMFAPVTFDHWDGDVPVGREEPNAWVQIVAVSQDQTQNTMKLMPSLISAEARRHYGVQVGKLNVYGLADTRAIHAVTSSPLSLEGPRPTLVVRNETQNWLLSNGGHDMAGAIEGNAAKSPQGRARMLDICNAYRPGENSVAETTRDAWQATQGDAPQARAFGLLYDSLEAPPEAPLTAEAAASVVQAVRGDSVWLSTSRIVSSILNLANPPSESRRKWYNQVTAAEDARFDPLAVKLCATTESLPPGDEIVMFGDGSKSDDATGLVGCRLSDGLTQVLHVQQPTRGQVVDRDRLDGAVVDAFDTFKVVGFWFDPSHAKDDDAEGDERFWWPLCDEWMRRYGRRLRMWSVKTGDSRHAVAWDMTSASRQAQFVPAVDSWTPTSNLTRFGSLNPGGCNGTCRTRNGTRAASGCRCVKSRVTRPRKSTSRCARPAHA